MPQRNVATNFTFEQQRTEINLLAADFWSHKTAVDGAASTYLKHDGSNDFTGGTLAVPAAFTINSNSGAGTVTISGNLNVTGTTTTVSSANLEVTDKNILIAKGSTSDANSDGAGITIDSATDITWNFVDAKDAWVSSIGVEATTFLKGPYGQFTGSGTPATGQGVEVNAPDANTGQIISYDRGNTAYKQLNIKGSSIQLYGGTTNALVGTFSSTGLNVDGVVTSDDLIVTGTSVVGDFKSTNNNYVLGIAGNNASDKAYVGTDSSGNFLIATGSGVDERLRIASDGQLIHKTNKSSGYIAEFHQEHADNPGTLLIDSPTDNNIRPAALHLAQAGTVKWVLGQVYSSTSSQAFHLCSGTGEANSKFVVTTAGNIGISEASPDNKLHITTTSSTAYDTNTSNTQNLTNALLKLENLDGSDGGGVNNYVGIQFTVANGATSSAQLNYVRTADNSGRFAFKARNGGGSDYPNLMDITSAGRVGINQTDPASTLHVENKSTGTTEADKRIAGFYKPSTSTASDREGYIHLGSWSSHYGVKLGYYNEGASPGYHNAGFFVSTINSNQGIDNHTKKLVVDSTGRVLIGADSTTSNAKLAVNGAIGSPEAFFELNRTDDPANGQNVGVIDFNQGNAASRNAARIITRRDGGVWGAASLPTRFEFHACNSGSNSATERMRITSDGAVQMEYLNPADGSTAARAARSAVEIKKYYPNSPNGNYWIIAPNGQGAKLVQCNMTTDGGGWMLWYAHNYGTNDMNTQCGGDSATPSTHIDAAYKGNYSNYTCWFEASKIDDGDRQMIDSFVQLDGSGAIRYKADYGEEFFPEEEGNVFNPVNSACFSGADAEWWGGNDMYPPTCGVQGGSWQNFSGGGWSRIWIREPESDISPGTVRNCHGIPRVYGRDHDGVPSWHVHDSAFIEPIWSRLVFNGPNLTQGNGNWISENGRAIGDLSQSNNGNCASARLKGYLLGEFEITFNLGYAWGWSLINLFNTRSMEERFSDPIGSGLSYGQGTYIKGGYSLYNNSSNNQWMPAKRNGAGVWTEYQNVPGAPQNVDNIMWRESDGTIKVRRADGTHGTHTFDQKWAGPFMVCSANQSPCYVNIKEIYDGRASWQKWYK